MRARRRSLYFNLWRDTKQKGCTREASGGVGYINSGSDQYCVLMSTNEMNQLESNAGVHVEADSKSHRSVLRFTTSTASLDLLKRSFSPHHCWILPRIRLVRRSELIVTPSFFTGTTSQDAALMINSSKLKKQTKACRIVDVVISSWNGDVGLTFLRKESPVSDLKP